ncbi:MULTISPECIES: Cro/CI family transcriptional regulator [unclassified Tatumella]|uniref:Cro/CI family transcriptional regulator n=1 Tax=unclassified Tatumella TaxID=2649542 RepID=UPI001BB01048|nr:helix-turn-helix domain-containing protein [Tatumella sp. JGM82]MBS0892056.1 helix-turn-helix domain-containing protein [Tatumella sp. JGM94]MBS0900835.1 helix-turn-helix domain-containing protein [Tatumella sp. JGM100]
MKKSELISYFGTTTAAAKALGVSKSTVSLWKKVVPWQYALLAEKVTNGGIKCSESEYPNITRVK